LVQKTPMAHFEPTTPCFLSRYIFQKRCGMQIDDSIPGMVLRGLVFAADRHRNQRRKDSEHSPYINHPLEVVEILWRIGEVRDAVTLTAAALHDTVEDTGTKPDEIEALFSADVRAVVLEVSDDKSLPKEVRKRLQVENAPHKSERAKLIKLADKITNVRDIITRPPQDWPEQRRLEYVAWARAVVAGMRDTNPALEAEFDRVTGG
jgi:GTP diphosphokinase / guanosine-3',5'-bis(diphosphate) 3'-diphosphatase